MSRGRNKEAAKSTKTAVGSWWKGTLVLVRFPFVSFDFIAEIILIINKPTNLVFHEDSFRALPELIWTPLSLPKPITAKINLFPLRFPLRIISSSAAHTNTGAPEQLFWLNCRKTSWWCALGWGNTLVFVYDARWMKSRYETHNNRSEPAKRQSTKHFISLHYSGSNWTPATLTPPKSTKSQPEDDDFTLPEFIDEKAIQQVSDMLTNTLRDAKQRHLLSCTEVLLPCELLQRIGVEMLRNSDEEACGIRGCNIIIEFEDEMGHKRQIASTKTDPNTVSTFELILTLKQDRSGWTSILPQFLK